MKRSTALLTAFLFGLLLVGISVTGLGPSRTPSPPHTFAIDAMLVALAIFPIVAILATVYLWHIRGEDLRPTKSWILTMLVVGSIMAMIEAFPISQLSVAYLWDREPLYPSIVVIVLCLLLSMSIPPYFALRIWWERRKRKRTGGQGFPPPGEHD